LIGGCTYWSAAGFSSELRAGVDALKSSPARKWRARGRIEHTLLDEGEGVHPNLPKTFARNRTLPQEVPNFAIHDKGPEPESPAPIGTGAQRYDLYTVGYYYAPATGGRAEEGLGHRVGRACYRVLRRIPIPRTSVNKGERKAGDPRGGPRHIMESDFA
jgi:hypothetical protein